MLSGIQKTLGHPMSLETVRGLHPPFSQQRHTETLSEPHGSLQFGPVYPEATYQDQTTVGTDSLGATLAVWKFSMWEMLTAWLPKPEGLVTPTCLHPE